MRIIVIDKNIDRHSNHRKKIKEKYSSLIRKVYKKCEITEFSKFQDDILIIHYNNKEEADYLLSSKDIGLVRIFFTGAWDGVGIKKDGADYLVGYDKLYSSEMIDIVKNTIYL